MQPNPRKVKRIINVFRLLRKPGEVRVAENVIDEFDDGLLAKIVVIQSRCRELCDDLQEYPKLIQDLEQHFRVTQEKTEATSHGVPTLLQKYVDFKASGQMICLPPYFESLRPDQIQLYLYMTHPVAEFAAESEEFEAELRKSNLEAIPIEPGKTMFNPANGRLAVSVSHNAQIPDGVITAVIRKGYMQEGRVVREAYVIVNQQAALEEET